VVALLTLKDLNQLLNTDLISLFTNTDSPRVTVIPSLLSIEDIFYAEIDSPPYHTGAVIIHEDDIIDIHEPDLSSIVSPPLKKRKCRSSEVCRRQNR
jgi:hypothetical protein